jgi:hypothetical protein
MEKPTKFTSEQLGKLQGDTEFQKRVGSDEELARLFCPQSQEWDVRSEMAVSLGMSRRIAGVDLPPVTLGMIGLLTAVGNEFVKVSPDWSKGFAYQIQQFNEALFVLRHGPLAVSAFADVFRYQRTLAAWRNDAASSPHIAAACVDAEGKIAAAMRQWDAAVISWSTASIRLDEGETLDKSIASLDDWLAQGLVGFKLFPETNTGGEGGKDQRPFGLMRKQRRALSRRLVRFAVAILPMKSAGKSR